MIDNWIWIAMLSAIVVSSLALAIGAWLPRGKGIPDWFMVVGGLLLPLGVTGMSAFVFVPNLSSSILGGEATGVIIYTSIAGGLLLFSMGYIGDRIGHARSTGRSFSSTPE